MKENIHKSLSSMRSSTFCSVHSCFIPDVFVDWKQNASEVIVRLRCGDGVQRVEDINAAFGDRHCHVCFPGIVRPIVYTTMVVDNNSWTVYGCAV